MTATIPSVRIGILASISLLVLLSAQGCPVTFDQRMADECQTLPANIDTSMTLTAGCYLVELPVTVTGGAILIIEPGVTIKFKQGMGMTVMSDGAMSAVGTAENPIVLTGEMKTRGYWNGLLFSSSDSPDNRLEHVTIEYGGGYDFFGWETARANLVLSGMGDALTRISVTNCTLRESAGSGFFTDDYVIIDDFSGNTVTTNAAGAGYTYAAVAGFLDDSTAYSGNDVDVVRVRGGAVETEQTWMAIDADYLFVTSTQVHAPLTIAPGAKLVFQTGTGLTVFSDGSLSAIGTAEQPITFTGEAGAPGSWNGLYFSSSDSANNRLEYVTVEFGGGHKFFGWDSARTNLVLQWSRINVTNSTFRNSDGWGIWVSDESIVNADLETANTFDANLLGNVYWEPS